MLLGCPGGRPRTWRCPAEVVLKGRAGGGTGCFFWGRGAWHGTTLPGTGLCGHGKSLRNTERPESPEKSEGRGESRVFWELWWAWRVQEAPGLWGHRKPHGLCRARGPWWVPRSLWDIGVPW